jgi:hypothetical protein
MVRIIWTYEHALWEEFIVLVLNDTALNGEDSPHPHASLFYNSMATLHQVKFHPPRRNFIDTYLRFRKSPSFFVLLCHQRNQLYSIIFHLTSTKWT